MWPRKRRAISSPAEAPDALDEILQNAYRYALSLAHDPAEAEDLVQEACIAILGARGSWDKPYLFTTIRNRFIDHYRRSQRVLFVSLDGGAEASTLAEADEPFALDVLEAGAIDRALGRLRLEERETLYLAVVEGYTAQEIADLTDRPRGTVLSLLHRTKRKLRQLLEEDLGA